MIDSIQVDSSLFIYDYQTDIFKSRGADIEQRNITLAARRRGFHLITDEVVRADAARLAIYRRTTFEPVQTGGYGEAKQSGEMEKLFHFCSEPKK